MVSQAAQKSAKVLSQPRTAAWRRLSRKATAVTASHSCPECGSLTLIRKDGCDWCSACGYTGVCGVGTLAAYRTSSRTLSILPVKALLPCG